MSRKAKQKAPLPPVTTAPVADPQPATKAAPGPNLPARQIPGWLPGLALVAMVLVAYIPALHGGFLWDDDAHISADDTLRLRDGLWQIWFRPGATCQYYPLTFSVFWFEYHLWGLNTLGYHVVNVLLHGTAAVLLWQVLRRLKVRGAWLAGGIFALHPVCVMSVAWMTELKNVLSATLALGAAWAYLKAAGLGVYAKEEFSDSSVKFQETAGTETKNLDWRFYVLALVLFQLALFAKTAVSFLPATLLLISWWCGHRLNWRAIWPVLPMLALAAAMGFFTVYMERNLQGASEARFQLSWLERVLISGRSFWFYLGKLFYPHQLAFIYERWTVNTRAGWQYLFPAATAAVLAAVWWFRKRLGKGLFVGLLHFYLAASFLILVVVLYMTRYTFVSDHWQYFGCLSVIVLFAAGMTWVLDRLPPSANFLKPAACGLLLLGLGLLTWRQCGMYRNAEALWQATLERSSKSSMAHSSYGNYLLLENHVKEAIPQFRRALELEPQNAEVRRNFAVALAQNNQLDEAIAEDRKVVDALPNDSVSYYNLGAALDQARGFDEAVTEFQRAATLDTTNDAPQYAWGNVLLEQGKVDDAVTHFRRALEIHPDDAVGHYNLGNLFSRIQKTNEAIVEFQRAVQLQPGNAMAHNNLGNIYYQQHRLDEAISEFKSTVDALPNDPRVRCELAYVLWQRGRTEEAIAQYKKALEMQPDLSAAQYGLRDIAWAFATSPDASARNGKRAIELMRELMRTPDGTNSLNLSALAAAEAETGQYEQALTDARNGMKAVSTNVTMEVLTRLGQEVTLFQTNQPFREDAQAGKNVSRGSR